jgi:transcriptional regulator with XRE-family HTH domain
MDTLTEYLGKSGITQRQLALVAEVSPSYMNEIVQQLKTPSLAVALRIHRATGGKVEIAALVKSPSVPADRGVKDGSLPANKRGNASPAVQGQAAGKSAGASS